MDESMSKQGCIAREKTILEEISELKIEELTKIYVRINNLCKENLNEYYLSTQRLERAIVMLSVMAAEKDKRVIED